MPETFLTLLAGGVMLSAVISDPRAVILRWLRLAGIIALSMTALAIFFAMRRDVPKPLDILLFAAMFGILSQLAFVQVARRATQRALAFAACAIAIVAGTLLLKNILTPRAASNANLLLLGTTCAFSAATVGLALMDMLLGHAYLNAAQMTMAPFLRMNRALAGAMIGRAALSIGATIVIQTLHPMEMFWTLYLVYIGTRWLVGLLVPGVFVYMAHDCIKRRATQSATGILYVAGVLIFIGEIIGLYLMSETGMPL
jgi:hypothetical protein